ncbi:MAG: dTDP-4-dehydrorhamnose 3,5-epimerase [Hyphomicrobiales bacterium]
MTSAQQYESIDGVVVRPLTPHRDSRGTFTEIYRESWELGCWPVQFNGVTSAAGVLRGMHVHIQHVDHLAVVAGTMLLALHDVRPWSRTAGTSCLIEIGANAPRAVVIPTGVAHGFYFPEPSVLVYGVSAYWDSNDEVACRWDSAELGLSWPTTAPILSERDAQAPDYAAFRATFLQSWRRMHGALPERCAS